MTTSAKPPDLKEIQHATQTRFFGLFIWARLAIVPLVVLLASWIGINDQTPWRRALMGLAILGISSVSIWDVVNFSRKKTATTRPIYRNIFATNFSICVIILATGSLESPILPLIVVAGLSNSLLPSPIVGRILVIGFQIPMVWLYAVISVYGLMPRAMPDVFGGGAGDGSNHVLLWTTAVILTAALIAFIGVGSRLRKAFESMLEKVIKDRDESLRLHSDAARTLTTLSGEIAHELKNPLASIKGLSALLARKLEGQEAERLEVLRREVDRMQSILQEFLNFSRPLVPLALEETDLSELCRDVADLHEGLAREKSISIDVESAGSLSSVCDRRKIKQVLINLLQNAIDASPRGGAIRLAVDELDEVEVVLRVMDEGPGLEEDAEETLFDAGVTTKSKGSGLGLTVARAIARQHGGELTLENGSQGGCIAEMILPKKPDPTPRRQP